jgi:hypothetical protein
MSSWKKALSVSNKKRAWSKSKGRWLSEDEEKALIELIKEKQQKIKEALDSESTIERDIRLGFEDHLRETKDDGEKT